MKRGFSAVWMWIILIAVIALMWTFSDASGTIPDGQSYTEVELKRDLEDEKVSSVNISPNREVPSGTVKVNLKDSTQKKMYTTDVNSVVALMQKYDFDNYQTGEVPGESILLSVLPMLLSFGLIFVFYIMMMRNAQGSGGANMKMMNFGKSRARMTNGDKVEVDFGKVAGLK